MGYLGYWPFRLGMGCLELQNVTSFTNLLGLFSSNIYTCTTHLHNEQHHEALIGDIVLVPTGTIFRKGHPVQCADP